jgi:hypothetical protein
LDNPSALIQEYVMSWPLLLPLNKQSSIKTAARFLLLLSVVFLGVSISGGRAQDTGGGLAQPGDLKMKLSVLGMGERESWADPGTWGALLITKEQAEELNRRWDEALAAFPAASDDPDADDSEKKEWGLMTREFQSGMAEILTPDQIELREEIKKMAYNLWRETAPPEGSSRSYQDFRPLFEEQLEALLTPEQLENYRSTSDLSPTGAANWKQ